MPLFERKITIRQASIADFAGVGASLAGNLDASSTGQEVGLDYNIAVRNPERLARFVGAKLPVSRKQMGEVSSKGSIDATLSKADLKLSANAAGAQIKIDGSVENCFANPRLNLRSAVTHPELKTALRNSHPNISRRRESLVRSRCAHIARHTERYLHQEIDAKLGPVAIAGQASFGKAQGRSSVNEPKDE